MSGAKLMAVVGTHYNVGVGAIFAAPPGFLGQQYSDQGDHVGIPLQMRRLLERSVGFFCDVSKMREMDAFGKTRGDGWDIINWVRTK